MITAFDAIVLGGGPAGAATAIPLARAGWRVALLERELFPRRKVCGEFISATTLPLLHQLGVAEAFTDLAGPDVTHVGLFAREQTISASMPPLRNADRGFGRAVGREFLDTLLLDEACASGVQVLQPWTANAVEHDRVVVSAQPNHAPVVLTAPVVIDARGSGNTRARPARPSDLFGFKARFFQAALAPGLMPLVAFPGGYGGMVHSHSGLVSFSCCIRRDELDRARQRWPAETAGASVFAHIMHFCAGVRRALRNARIEDRWRASGPIRPGIRLSIAGNRWLAGNAAGEAHPVVAEGISMAIQGGWMLAAHLIRQPNVERARVEYVHEWRRMFAPRIQVSRAIAWWAMSSTAVSWTLPLLAAFPAMLTEGARTSGKVTPICSPSF